MSRTKLDTTAICTIHTLGIALFQEAQRLTCGQAYRSCHLCAALRACELDACCCPDACFCALALLSLADLAVHAPGTTIVIPDWPATLYRLIAHCGEATGRDISAIFAWAQIRWPGVILLGTQEDANETTAAAVLRYVWPAQNRHSLQADDEAGDAIPPGLPSQMLVR
jgi:hypothetical protein